MKKIVVTGGAGFIGANFVRFLVDKYENLEILVFDKLTYAGNLPNIAELIDRGKVKFLQGDISKVEDVNGLFERFNPDAVVNFAAETHVDRSIIDPQVFVMTNVVGTHNLLLACRDFGGVRFHQVSTDEVYGDLGDDSEIFFIESTPLEPNCPYAASKAAADLMVLSYFRTYGMPVTISRCSNNYGPYQYPEKLVPFFFKLASEGKELPVYGDGLNVRDWLYVKDHCEAIDLILSSSFYGEVFNIGGHNEKTNLEITSIILKFLGKDEKLIKFVEDRKAHDRRYAIDPSKIKAKLGWEPTVRFEDGIRMTFDWYSQNSEWVNAVFNKNN